MKAIKLIFILTFISMGGFTSAQDIAGAKDHPLIERFPGSKIIHHFQKDYNEVEAAIKPGSSEAPPAERLILKGKHTSIVYEAPESRSSLELMRNFEQAIISVGGEILFQCAGGKCDGTDAWYNARFFVTLYGNKARTGRDSDHYFPFESFHRDQRYLVAKIPTEEIEYYLEIAINPKYDQYTNKILFEIIESKPIATDLVNVNAKVLRDQLDKEGKIALYGIFFDLGKSGIKPESATELNAVADYLKSNPEVRLYIVGHTDDTGTFEGNMKLSQDRAEAVVRYLSSNLGVSKDRLHPWGVGPTSPKGPNTTEKGKNQNRRVELVKRL